MKKIWVICLLLGLMVNAKPLFANGDPGPPRDDYDANRFDARGYVNTYQDLLDAYYGEGSEGEPESSLVVVSYVEDSPDVEQTAPDPQAAPDEQIALESDVQEIPQEALQDAPDMEPEPMALAVEVIVIGEAAAPIVVDASQVDEDTVAVQLVSVDAPEVVEIQDELQEVQAPSGIEASAQALIAPELIQPIQAGTYNPDIFENGQTTLLPAYGKAMYYNPGVMQRVIAYRMKMGEIRVCEQCVGFAAMLLPGDLNRIVWIILDDNSMEGPFLVVDMAAPQHVDGLIQRQWLIDVDYETAMRWGMNGPIWVTVLDHSPE